MVLAGLLLLGGRAVHQGLLVGPEGRWREHLWLDELLAGPEPAQAAPAAPRAVLTTPLPINTCGTDSLTLLPGVGPVLAGRIATARREGVVFRNMSDLRRVKGIGPHLAARLDTLVSYETPAGADSSVTATPVKSP